ncbi:PDR/VanB family oxidoreductase [Paeniglutamicibacter sp. NPDC091659]|uniref:PDR/VanB family oxidoreductase n=1 Tax=Paeniglutamicibacter sp. NPDC091659 TaxID=3364389 RepID=UPI00381F677A
MTTPLLERTSRAAAATLEVMVVATRREATDITSFELVAADGSALPDWTPGAHVDVHLPSGIVRQYSLCGDPGTNSSYTIAVLEQFAGRGGSLEAHRALRAGSRITIGTPRDNFPLVEAPRYVFVAGGIGITPILAMIKKVQSTGGVWELVYGARSDDHFAFAGELRELGGGQVRFVSAETDGHPDLDTLVEESAGAAVYCCGPGPLMDALAAKMDAAGRSPDLFLERFTQAPAAPVETDTGESGTGSFTVFLARSGTEVEVDPGQSVLDAIRSAGVEHPSSCEMGFCGTCEAQVLEGEVDHRDDLLTEAERAANDCMMTCVSRACGKKLVLDL